MCAYLFNLETCHLHSKPTLMHGFRAPSATGEDDRVQSPDRLDAAHRGPARVPETAMSVATVAVVPAHHAARTVAGRQLQ